MKTIEERARLAAWQIYEEIGLSRHSVDRVSEIIAENIIEQKAIYIEKACEIVRNIANEYFGDWEQSCKVEDTFRKAMEKKILSVRQWRNNYEAIDINKACIILCRYVCPHKTDDSKCLNDKCYTCKMFRRMMEE